MYNLIHYILIINSFRNHIIIIFCLIWHIINSIIYKLIIYIIYWNTHSFWNDFLLSICFVLTEFDILNIISITYLNTVLETVNNIIVFLYHVFGNVDIQLISVPLIRFIYYNTFYFPYINPFFLLYYCNLLFSVYYI